MSVGEISRVVDQKVRYYQREHGCGYREALSEILRADPELSRRYHYGDNRGAEEFCKAGEHTHELAYERMQRTGSDYVTALHDIVHEAEEEEQRGIQSYARDMNLSKQEAAMLYARDHGYAQPITAGELLDAKAKEYSRSNGVAYSEALQAVLDQDENLKAAYRLGPDTRLYSAEDAAGRNQTNI